MNLRLYNTGLSYTCLPNDSRFQFLSVQSSCGVISREYRELYYGRKSCPIKASYSRSKSRGRGTDHKWIVCVASDSSSTIQTAEEKDGKTSAKGKEEAGCRVKLETLDGCKLGIGKFPDFEYNAGGGGGDGIGVNMRGGRIALNFDVESLNIPALTYETTKFLGLPLPPFLTITIVPLMFQGFIEQHTGQVELKFRADFYLSMASLYKPPPLLVETFLTTEKAEGEMRNGRGQRIDSKGRCRLVGVATVVRINDFFINAFLNLPTECLADMSARILVT
uniref:Uncharacterized protein n=1 Tax=Picea sitchensis TaxID=3332 RepID=C0PSB0_PICSI|nr:unknown [Picea sitchensis]